MSPPSLGPAPRVLARARRQWLAPRRRVPGVSAESGRNPRERATPSRSHRWLEVLLWYGVGALLRGFALVANRVARREPLLARALRQAPATYRLTNRQTGGSWYLTLADGALRATSRAPMPPVSALTLRNARVLASVRAETLLSSMVNGDVIQEGNTYQLYRLGFVLGLLQHHLSGRRARGAH